MQHTGWPKSKPLPGFAKSCTKMCENSSAETTVAERGRNLVAELWGRTLGENWPPELTSSKGKWCQRDGSLPVTIWCDVLLLTTPRRWAALHAGPDLRLESPGRRYRRGSYWLCDWDPWGFGPQVESLVSLGCCIRRGTCRCRLPPLHQDNKAQLSQ